MALCKSHMTARYPTKQQAADETPPASRVESPVAVYGAMTALDPWLAVLHDLGLKMAGSTLAQVREALRLGVPRHAFERIKGDLGVSTEEFAEVLGIPPRTLARRTDRFKPDESERLLRVGAVLRKAQDVLEDKEAARRWMTQPKRALGGLTPLQSCDTEVGARETEALLSRIEHGVFS